MTGALEKSTNLTFRNATASSNEDLLETEEDFASIGGSNYKNSLSPRLFSTKIPLNKSSDEQEKFAAMERDARTVIAICLGVVIAIYIIFVIIIKRRGRDSNVEDEAGTRDQGRFQLFCSRIANVICCKEKITDADSDTDENPPRKCLACFSCPLKQNNEVKCPIQIIVEDYDEILRMQQAKSEQIGENPGKNEQQEKNNATGTVSVGVECHPTSTEIKKEQNVTGTSGLDTMKQRQDDEDFFDAVEEIDLQLI